MKSDIHPQIFPDAKVTCTSCKAVFLIPGTKKDLQIEICSQCHPVYTGKYRGVISSGQVDKFRKKMATAKSIKADSKPKRRRASDLEKMQKKIEESKAEKQAKKEVADKKKREKLVRAAKKTVKKAPARRSSAERSGGGGKMATKKK
jgi:large subunit ribosomal protein L31